ncbi:transcriptional regulator [Vibrio tasmaniensis]|nr:transcriptional regulator [Vibrio tasmaniensis]
MFGKIIKTFRESNGFSQSNFVEIIQRSSHDFKKLDVVTLSRWERGITTPHLKRQNELLDILGADIFDVWGDKFSENNSIELKNKINNNGYFNLVSLIKPEIKIINSNNSHVLAEVINLIDVIFEYEGNLIFEHLEATGLSRQSIVEKVIDQYAGEMTLITVNGQLLGHLISADLKLMIDLFKEDTDFSNEKDLLILSFNCTHDYIFSNLIGKEVYRYLHSTNPKRKLYVLLKNKRMFDLFFFLGFDYKTIKNKSISMKMMFTRSSEIKSKRVWMEIVSKFKEKSNV